MTGQACQHALLMHEGKMLCLSEKETVAGVAGNISLYNL